MTKSNLNVGASKTARLSDAALVLLSHAANRDDGMVLPPPTSVRARGKALEKVLATLLRQGFIEEITVATAEQAWRTAEDGSRIGLRITRSGLNAIGGGATVDAAENAGIPAAASETNACGKEAAGSHREPPSDSSGDRLTGDTEESGSSASLDQGGDQAELPKATGIRPDSKQALLLAQLQRPAGAGIAELVSLLAWQPHTVRAAITGLRQKGHAISRSRNEQGETVYRADAQATAAELAPEAE